MANENNDIKNLDLDALIGNMSSINSEDYWFTKVSKIEEHDETAELKQGANKAKTKTPKQRRSAHPEDSARERFLLAWTRQKSLNFAFGNPPIFDSIFCTCYDELRLQFQRLYSQYQTLS